MKQKEIDSKIGKLFRERVVIENQLRNAQQKISIVNNKIADLMNIKPDVKGKKDE